MCVCDRERNRQQAWVEKGEPQNKKGHKRYIFYSLLLLWICKLLLGLSLFPRNGCLSAQFGVSAPTGVIYVWNKGYIKNLLYWKAWCYFKTCLLLLDIMNAKQTWGWGWHWQWKIVFRNRHLPLCFRLDSTAQIDKGKGVLDRSFLESWLRISLSSQCFNIQVSVCSRKRGV